MRIKVVLFDLWGTLILDDRTDERSRLRVQRAHDALAARGFAHDIGSIGAAFDVAGEELSKIHAEGLDLSTYGRTVLYMRHLDATLGERLDDDGWRALHEAVLTPARTFRPSLVAGAAECIGAVAGLGLPIGLISNAGITPGFVLREILAGYGLLASFDHTVFSDEVELSKPSAAIFEHALELFGIDAGEAVFVGDQPLLDVLGPRAAGLWSVQFGALTADGIEPHARIHALSELVPALRDLRLV